MIDGHVMRIYRKLRAKRWHAREALRAAKVRAAFEECERDELVRLRVEPDDQPYMFGDAEDEPETRARIEQHGVWGLVGEYRCHCCDAWVHVDSCWGFVGDDVDDNGTDTDIMKATLEALAEARHAC